MYSIYTSADGEIKAPLIHPPLCLRVFVTFKPCLFLALVHFDLLLAVATHFIALMVYFLNSIT